MKMDIMKTDVNLDIRQSAEIRSIKFGPETRGHVTNKLNFKNVSKCMRKYLAEFERWVCETLLYKLRYKSQQHFASTFTALTNPEEAFDILEDIAG